MSEKSKKTIFNDLYNARMPEYKSSFIKENGETKEMQEIEQKQKDLTYLLDHTIKDEKSRLEILKKIQELNNINNKNMNFWCQKHYYWGICDKLELKETFLLEDLKDNIKKRKATTFLSEMFENFTMYFEDLKKDLLTDRDDYEDVITKINELKEKYPKVKMFLEENEFSDFTKEEQDALIEINQQYCRVIDIMLEVTYRLGILESV